MGANETLGWRFGYHFVFLLFFSVVQVQRKNAQMCEVSTGRSLFCCVASNYPPTPPHPTPINLHYQPEGSPPPSQTPQAPPTPTRGRPCQTRALVCQRPLFLFFLKPKNLTCHHRPDWGKGRKGSHHNVSVSCRTTAFTAPRPRAPSSCSPSPRPAPAPRRTTCAGLEWKGFEVVG